MVNALNSGVSGVKNQPLELDGMRAEKKQNTQEASKEESKVEKFRKSIEIDKFMFFLFHFQS